MLMGMIAMGVALAGAPSSQERMVRAQDPQSLVDAMRAGGYEATLKVDAVGDPMISSKAESGTKFQIFFYNCTAHKNCATVQFHTGYTLEKQVTLEALNEWSQGERFGRAYLDKVNDPIVAMDLDLDDGGISPLLFIDNLEFWTSVLGKFEKHIGFRD